MNARIYEKRAQMSKTRKAVKLVSAEGFEFYVDYRAACVSNTIKQMLSSSGAASVLSQKGVKVFPSLAPLSLGLLCGCLLSSPRRRSPVKAT